jgi:uncharacterized radical SAM superfamily protein
MFQSHQIGLDPSLEELFARAWKESRARHGNHLSVHIPGMFVVNGRRGRFRAVSITGDVCALDCEHCKGLLLKTMAHADTSDELLRLGHETVARGDHGMLITGGCDDRGRLPWDKFLDAIDRLTSETDLTITVHAGQVDKQTAKGLKKAGVRQALVDVIGDDSTARDVYHFKDGVSTIFRTLDYLNEVGLEIVPHIVYGLHYGKEKGERAALEILAHYPLSRYVIVVLMPFRGTPMELISPPDPQSVAAFISMARLRLPDLKAGLGCARPRGRYRQELDDLAVRAGINSIALPSDRALQRAREMRLEITHHDICCSLG